MGKIKYIKEIRDFFKRSPVVDINSLKRFIESKKGDKSYVHQLLRNMVKNKEIKRITKGYYTIHEDTSLAVFCFNPAYLGLQDALSFQGLWEQETNPIVITTNRVRQGLRTFFKNNVLVRRISPEYYFGIDLKKYGDFYLPVSNIEKTFIDMIYFRQKMDRDVIENFKKQINYKQLNSYLKKYPLKFQKRVNFKLQ